MNSFIIRGESLDLCPIYIPLRTNVNKLKTGM